MPNALLERFKSRPMHPAWKAAPNGVLVTEIGSLPHPNVDSALETSFRCNVPFLPQLPIRRAQEFMLPQALDGFPGLFADSEGLIQIRVHEWRPRAERWGRELKDALKRAATDPEALARFEPSPSVASAWQPFLWEIEERAVRFAKIQIAGPFTCQWSATLDSGGGTPITSDERSLLRSQILELVLVRALAMCRRVRERGAEPFLMFDEPGLTALSLGRDAEPLALRELGIAIQALQKENFLVGVHCCGETRWPELLALRPNLLSLDLGVSLGSLLKHPQAVMDFVLAGGTFSWGIVPNTWGAKELSTLSGGDLLKHLRDPLRVAFEPLFRKAGELSNTDLDGFLDQLLEHSLFTPACGLALQSPEDAEAVLGTLFRVQTAVSDSIA